jgi:DNA-binding NarL/FixJ family response regulator
MGQRRPRDGIVDRSGRPPGGGRHAVRSTTGSHRGSIGRDTEGARPVGVLVVDDSLVFRTGMTRAVQACEGLTLLGEADGGEAALRAIADLDPDIVILDLRMPDLDGIEVLRALHAQDPPPDCRVLVISATLDDAVEAEAIAAGAAACLSKAETRASICDVALRLVAQ